jgi:ABC-type transport system involved in multi-copper enzyme maturation permease subunit
MIWLTWRQHRTQFLYTLLVIAAVAAVMLPTGLAMRHTFEDSGLAACIEKLGTAAVVPPGDCDVLSQQFADKYNALTFVGVLFVILPVFVGIFFGAPLVAREVEQGTHRFVWTQGITRRRWAASKFGLVGLAAAVIAVLYALGVSWWFGPLVTNGGGRLAYVSFDVQGVVPIAYTIFAVALGICLGTVFRKVLPAMGVTLAAFLAVRVAVEWGARKHYLSPETVTLPITSTDQFNRYGGAWTYQTGVRNAAGQVVIPDGMVQCAFGTGKAAGTRGSGSGVPLGSSPCSSLGKGAVDFQVLQPGSRFWDFQAIESGIFVGLAVLLVWLALSRVRRLT